MLYAPTTKGTQISKKAICAYHPELQMKPNTQTTAAITNYVRHKYDPQPCAVFEAFPALAAIFTLGGISLWEQR